MQHEKMQILGKERAKIEVILHKVDEFDHQIKEMQELVSLAHHEEHDVLKSIQQDISHLEASLVDWEFRRLFQDKVDSHSAYMEIQAGAGGTEAQDWAEMLLKMYLKWGENKGFKTTLIEKSDGEIAGIKSATIHFKGDYAYGWLRTETGVHRLVRPSPFDSNQRRHTSFASVFISPEVDDQIDIQINPADIRIDTYRASGAGGQHVQKTDSAVRIKHLPTNIIVQCQNDRSQHRNRDQAMRQLRAKLYAFYRQQQRVEQQAREAEKSDIGWGSQIRSYVIDASRIKDLRTGVEISDIQSILREAKIDVFLRASLEQGF